MDDKQKLLQSLLDNPDVDDMISTYFAAVQQNGQKGKVAQPNEAGETQADHADGDSENEIAMVWLLLLILRHKLSK